MKRVTAQNGQANPLHLLNRYRLELFHSHCSLIEQLFLKHWEAHLNGRPASPIKPAWDCILIDDRPTRQTKICILNTLLMTRLKASMTIYTPATKTKDFEALLEPVRDYVAIKNLDAFGITDSLGWSSYNTLLKSAQFWRSLGSQHVLVFQPDSLLIQPLDLELLHYDYAGSPWNKGRITSCSFPSYDPSMRLTGNIWINQALCQTVPDHTNNGNGGLSIRNPKLMQAICENHATESPEDEAEDIFFARYIHLDIYKAALPSQEALSGLFNESSYSDSCGFHGSWYYLDPGDQARLYEKHTKHVIGLLMALS